MNTESPGLFNVYIYELNWLMVFVGLILFVGIFVLIWEKMLSVKFSELWSLAIGWRVAVIVITLFALTAMFFALIFMIILSTGIFGTASKTMEWMLLLTPMFIAVIYPTVRLAVAAIRRKKRG